MENNAEGNGWPEYRREVMAAIRDLKADMKAVDDKVDVLSLDVARLNVRASLWGFIAGAIPAALSYLLPGKGK
jgi:hypothetical protein